MAYIGRSMSENAYKAHREGLVVKSQVNSKILKSHGFKYSVNFFKWLCKNGYIKPVAYHHTSAFYKSTPFYSLKVIGFMQKHCNLDILYKLYLNKTNKVEIKKELKIKYAKVLVSGDLLNLKCEPIEYHCVLYKSLLFWSTNTAFQRNSKKLKIIEVLDKRPAHNWNNKNTKKIINKIILYKHPKVKILR